MLVRLGEKERILYHSIAVSGEGGQISDMVTWLMWENLGPRPKAHSVQKYSIHDIKVTYITTELGH